MPGHKGLLGPQGTGILLCFAQPEPLLYGGTGSQSMLQTMPEQLPDRLEAGTHNVPGIAGLLAGIRYVSAQGIAVRAGLHCAPVAHRTAGTLETGTVRLSLSPFTTDADIAHTARAFHDILRTGKSGFLY